MNHPHFEDQSINQTKDPQPINQSNDQQSINQSMDPLMANDPLEINKNGNHVILTYQSIDHYNPQSFVSNQPTNQSTDQSINQSIGGISVFIGVTRDSFNGRKVKKLSYEAYQSMAIYQLYNLCEKVRLVYQSISRCFIIHRLGDVSINQSSVMIATSSPHRADCINATEWLIDQLKASVAIWKKEVYEDDLPNQSVNQSVSQLGDQTINQSVTENAVWKANPESFELIGVPILMKQTTDFQLAGDIDEDID